MIAAIGIAIEYLAVEILRAAAGRNWHTRRLRNQRREFGCELRARADAEGRKIGRRIGVSPDYNPVARSAVRSVLRQGYSRVEAPAVRRYSAGTPLWKFNNRVEPDFIDHFLQGISGRNGG